MTLSKDLAIRAKIFACSAVRDSKTITGRAVSAIGDAAVPVCSPSQSVMSMSPQGQSWAKTPCGAKSGRTVT